jgi:tetratricopeptide (TPR) repeat protein/energy-coupling factor transporter ATP-binding protein EcfA2
MVMPLTSALSADRPFPGLRPFGALDQPFFFGRSAQFYALYRLLDLSRFVAVIGNSGSGKSSLVRAGLLPLLHQERSESSGRQWVWVEMRPGDVPLQSLTSALTRLAETLSTTDDPIIAAARADRISYHLRGSSHGVSRAIGEMDRAETRTIVLVVDQFEELFRFATAGSISGVLPIEEARLREETVHFVQLLLEASRSPETRVHVILTMRSDFIGDCARFQGLPEAVSATQFLVPSLTRDQREEVIKGPIALAGATIEPSLVEQLLNDSGSELDQLPVMQHCLLRLWERAGLRSRENARTPEVDQLGRHISMREYEEIHKIGGALSQHADEILNNDLHGLEQAVERIFRALSDLDRDGRATRRALSFQQLAAETAIRDNVLRRLLDRLRADDCSFLTPSPAEAQTLDARSRIDVGHEALLRRWESVSGVPGATGDKSDGRSIGWLKDEHRDGQRYQALLAMTNGVDSEPTLLPFDQVGRYWDWWNAMPHTEAWAERYGGCHARVARLLEDSQGAHQRLQLQRQAEKNNKRMAQRMRVAAIVLGLLSISAIGSGFVIARLYFDARSQEKSARETANLALDTVQNVVSSVQEGLNYGTIKVEGARGLLAGIETTLKRVPNSAPDVIAVKIDILMVVSDAMRVLGERNEALMRAQAAGGLAEELSAVDPHRADWQWLIYASAFRIADATLSLGLSPDNIKRALDHYRTAQAVAERLSAAEPERGDRLFDLAFIHNKVGEAMQIKEDYPNALAQFQMALEIAKRAAASDPNNITWQAYVPATFVKIASILAVQTPADFEGALSNYSIALSMQEQLLNHAPTNNVLLSNFASAHRGKADIFVSRWGPADDKEAVKGYSIAILLLSELSAKDAANAIWLSKLAPCYARLGSAFEKTGDVSSALTQYQKELEIRASLAKKDPTNKEWRANLESTRKKIGGLRTAKVE